MELFWNSLDNGPSSIIFYLVMKVEVEVGVQDIRERFTPRFQVCFIILELISFNYSGSSSYSFLSMNSLSFVGNTIHHFTN